MAKYRKVDPRVWLDAKFNALPASGKLIFLFLLTNPALTSVGAMRLSKTAIREQVGPLDAFAEGYKEGYSKGYGEGLPKPLPQPLPIPFPEPFGNGYLDPFEKGFLSLISSGLIRYDEQTFLVWLPHFLKYNKPENPNVIKGWVNAISELPECPLLIDLLRSAKAYASKAGAIFEDAYPSELIDLENELLSHDFEPFRNGYPNGSLNGLGNGYPNGYPNRMPNQEQEQEQEQNKEKENEKRKSQKSEKAESALLENDNQISNDDETTSPVNPTPESIKTDKTESDSQLVDAKPSTSPLNAPTSSQEGAGGTKSPKSPVVRSMTPKKPSEASEDLWADFVALRNKKRKPITERVIENLRSNAKKAGLTLDEALEVVTVMGWETFKPHYDYSHVINKPKPQAQGAKYVPDSYLTTEQLFG